MVPVVSDVNIDGIRHYKWELILEPSYKQPMYHESGIDIEQGSDKIITDISFNQYSVSTSILCCDNTPSS